MKFITFSLISLASSLVAGQSFCSNSSHSGQSEKVTSNKVGSIGNIGYELWSDSGNNSATFYSDGSFSCTFQNAKDYLCRTGLSFDSTQTHDQIGHMYADFRLVKQNIQNVDYSYVGIYGWSRDPLVEYYIVDNWLSQYRPGDWVGNKKHGDFTIDGATYTVYENTRYGPSIDGDTNFKQFFSIRQQARDCGTIDITAHFQQWEKLGMKLGKMHEAKVLGEAGSTGSGTSGTADFPYAKVYIGSGNGNQQNAVSSSSSSNSSKTLPSSSSSSGSKTLPSSASSSGSKTLPTSSSSSGNSKTLPSSSSSSGYSKTLPATSSTTTKLSKTLPSSSATSSSGSKTLPSSSSSSSGSKTLPSSSSSSSSGSKTIPSSSSSSSGGSKTLPATTTTSASKTVPSSSSNGNCNCQPVTVTVTVTANSQATSSNNNGGSCAQLWAQCGGNGFSGPTCCQEGTCQQVNEWYSQCV